MSGKMTDKPVVTAREGLLKDLFIMPEYDESGIRVTFTAPQGCKAVNWFVLGREGVVEKGQVGDVSEKVNFEASIKDFRPWNIDNPYLYTLKLQLQTEDKTYRVSEHFGMRKIHATKDHIYVNNEKFYARGYIRGREAHDHPNLENLPLEEFYAKNIRNAKKYGFNMMRFHSRIPPKECFQAADKLGIFIHIELRLYYGKYQKERTMMNDEGELISRQDWADVIEKYRNHPSLMVYCMGNEIRHPGTNPYVAEISKLTKKLDPTRLFIDTCAHGEFDRDNVDIDVQHMSYFYPFGEHYDMFDNTYNWYIYGSAKGVELVNQAADDDYTYKVTRAIEPRRPILAHEVCHYVAMRDIYNLDQKFTRLGVEKPWWIDEIKKLIELKGLKEDFPQMFKASKRFQFLNWKLGIEAARRSPLLCGFHFLQLADTERYENSNGILDCFDDQTGIDEKGFLKFNADTAILADLPRRTFFEGEKLNIPVILSHYSPDISGMAGFSFSIKSKDGSEVSISGSLDQIDLDQRGRREIAAVEVSLPAVKKAHELAVTFKLDAHDKSYTIDNSWDIWLYPDRPERLGQMTATVILDEVNLSLRYPQIKSKGTAERPEKLMIVNRFSKQVLNHLDSGGDVLMLYRVPETRDRKVRAEKENYYLPASWDRLKGVVWDRGTNCGAFMRQSRALEGFPNDGYVNMQFHGLIDDCDKIDLDGFPVEVEPIMQGVDKASRDRFDVYTFKLSELQPDWTMRKFAYMFELKVAKGRLFVTGFNFTGLNNGRPEACAMFESIMRYISSDDFRPDSSIETEKLEEYLLKKGNAPRIKERKMTQYWQLDAEPLESDRYWRESEEYIRRG